MSTLNTMQVHLPEDIQVAASQVIHAAGLTVDDVAHGLMRRIAHDHSVPPELVGLDTQQEASTARRREHAIESIKQWHTRIIGPPMTIEEIISARDEGHR